jgi:hypothetical protein
MHIKPSESLKQALKQPSYSITKFAKEHQVLSTISTIFNVGGALDYWTSRKHGSSDYSILFNELERARGISIMTVGTAIFLLPYCVHIYKIRKLKKIANSSSK